MKTIWKFEFPISIGAYLKMPAGAKILHVARQYPNVATFWAEVDDLAEMEERFFAVVGTGNPIPEDVNCEYVGTFIDPPFVWHLYEILESDNAKG